MPAVRTWAAAGAATVPLFITQPSRLLLYATIIGFATLMVSRHEGMFGLGQFGPEALDFLGRHGAHVGIGIGDCGQFNQLCAHGHDPLCDPRNWFKLGIVTRRGYEVGPFERARGEAGFEFGEAGSDLGEAGFGDGHVTARLLPP